MPRPHSDLAAKHRLDALASETGSTEVGYTPADGAKWSDPDPTTVAGALDQLADRADTLENAAAPAATLVAYTPTDGSDWPDPDPTTVASALDQLADRADTLESAAAPAATLVAYTPTDGSDWPDPDPTTVAGALDELASRTNARIDLATALDAEGTQAAETRRLTITATDENGSPVSGARVVVELLNNDLAPADGSQQVFSNVATGTVESESTPLADTRLLIAASAGGVIEVDVNDKSTNLDGTLYAKVTPLDRIGTHKVVPIEFASP